MVNPWHMLQAPIDGRLLKSCVGKLRQWPAEQKGKALSCWSGSGSFVGSVLGQDVCNL
jgi:hypothetical protein